MKRNQASKTTQPKDSRVYASLQELVTLRAKARGFSFLPQQPIASLLSGRKRSRLRGRGMDFEELRHYRQGDEVRNIDWKVTNRTGKPHVRVYNEEKDRPVLVVVDQRLPMFFGSQEKLKSVVACELAALSMWNVLKNGDRIGAVLFDDEKIEDFKPARSKYANMAILSSLIDMNHALSVDIRHQTNTHQLELALKRVEQLVGHDYLVIVISDFSGWNKEVLNSIKRIGQHNDLITGLVFDPLEEDISSSSSLVVSDGDYQVEIPADQSEFTQSYKETFQLSVAEIKSVLQKHDIPLLPISTVGDSVSQLRKYLGGL